jgi:hypothetical protein
MKTILSLCFAFACSLAHAGTINGAAVGVVDGSGTVTSISSPNASLTVGSATTTPTLQVVYGTTANTAAQGNDSRFTSSTQIKANVALTNQGADIASTNIANTSTAGLYRVSWDVETTTSDAAAGQTTLDITWTDGAGSANLINSSAAAQTPTISLTSSQRTVGTAFVHVASGSIAYSMTVSGSYGTSKYALNITVERML